MTIFSIMYTILIQPLQLLFEIIYQTANYVLDNPGLSIVALSLLMNLLVLPLYKRADAMQEAARDMDLKLSKGVKHIKKTFSGEEKMMILQAYYRQNNYKPTDALKGSVSLLLEIPFFMAAYQFLAHLSLLKGATLGPINDLGAPDGLLIIGGETINLLPILMILINVISSTIYLKGFPAKTKVQLYGMSVFFLIFLYNSPAGLVFYWTLNNVFSLGKTICLKMKNPRRAVSAIIYGVGACVIGYGLWSESVSAVRSEIVTMGASIILINALVAYMRHRKNAEHTKQTETEDAKHTDADTVASYTDTASDKADTEKVAMQATSDKADSTTKVSLQKQANSTCIIQTNTDSEITDTANQAIDTTYIFTTASLLLAVVLGGLIPSALIASSPQEFINIIDYKSPLWYVVFTLCMAVGSCLVWMQVFFWLAKPKTKKKLDKIITVASVIIVINYMFFGTDLGTMTPDLKFQKELVTEFNDIVKNLVAIGLVIIFTLIIYKKWRNVLKNTIAVVICAMVGMTIINSVKINTQAKKAYANLESANTQVPYFTLSKEGKNVIVIMLDRALGYMVPYAVNELPELKEQFDGFTYYSNIISFSSSTNCGAPALYGGYEYTPVEINKRDEETLVDKHNEALKVMPVMFLNEDYKVTVCDSPYANYQWIPDMSIYDEYPEMNTFVTEGKFGEQAEGKLDEGKLRKRFFCYSLMKAAPVCLQELIYGDGSYNLVIDEAETSTQHTEGTTKAVGQNYNFLKSYNVLHSLPDMTIVEEGSKNTFMVMCNNMTHEPVYLQAPMYEPLDVVDNTSYDAWHGDRFTVNGVTLNMENEGHMAHYHTNIAALLQIGRWLDYLKEMGVYDNTRIIIVSDHGRNLDQVNELIYNTEDEDVDVDITTYYPLLMVKDFDAKGFTVSDEFMTNGDVPTLATAGLIENPTNPFTGNAINNDEKYAHPQYISIAEDWHVETNNGNVFKPTKWLSIDGVGGNIWDMDSWSYIDQETTIPVGAEY